MDKLRTKFCTYGDCGCNRQTIPQNFIRIIVQWQCEQHCKRRVRPSPKIKGEPSKLQPKYTWNNVSKNSPTFKKGYFQISLVQHSIHGILVVQVLIHFLHRRLGILDKTTQLNSFFSQIKWPLNDSNKRIRDYLFLPNTVITQYNSENQQHMFHRKRWKGRKMNKACTPFESRGGEGRRGFWLSNSYYWNVCNVCAVLGKLTHSINTWCDFQGLTDLFAMETFSWI